MRSITWVVLAVVALACPATASPRDLLADLWMGKAHFRQIARIDWAAAPYRDPLEQAGSIATADDDWYIINRTTTAQPIPGCRLDHARLIVRVSHDHGASWSNPPAAAVSPGASSSGDGCAILDGTAYFDAQTGTWQLIAQCLDKDNAGGWALCHYSRKAATPLGPFVADPGNPVVRGNQLWSAICAGVGKACDPRRTRDEGTPDIVEKRGGFFYVTFHGFDYQADRSYRGVARTRDFQTWITSGADLPGDALLGPENCRTWSSGCIGIGETTSVISGGYQYVLAEGPNKSLLCTDGQDWPFGLARAPVGTWPRWNSGRWEIRDKPLLRETWPSAGTRCGLQYARWIKDGSGIYLLYEDWGPHRQWVVRRLLKLVAGAGRAVELSGSARAGSAQPR